MHPHHREDKYLDKIIKEKFSSALMNDSKWVKIISILVKNANSIKKCLLKPIWDDKEPTRELLIDENRQFGFDFYHNAMESMVSGNPRGWYAYKEIEWIDFPKSYLENDKKAIQDLDLIEQVLLSVGTLRSDKTDNNLRLYSYQK